MSPGHAMSLMHDDVQRNKLANSFKRSRKKEIVTKLTAEEHGDVVAVGVKGELGEVCLHFRKLANGGEHFLCSFKCRSHLYFFQQARSSRVQLCTMVKAWCTIILKMHTGMTGVPVSEEDPIDVT